MKTYHTYPQYLADCTEVGPNSHRPPAAPYLWVCDRCGKASMPGSYGLIGHSMHCYDCCHAMDVKHLLDRSKPFTGYLSSDGKRFTNWPGSPLGHVVHSSTYRTGWHESEITHVRVRDVHGSLWHGKGAGPGMFLKLRPMKG